MDHVAIDLGGRESQICVRNATNDIVLEKREQVLDARSAGRFKGVDPEPRHDRVVLGLRPGEDDVLGGQRAREVVSGAVVRVHVRERDGDLAAHHRRQPDRLPGEEAEVEVGGGHSWPWPRVWSAAAAAAASHRRDPRYCGGAGGVSAMGYG